MFFPAILIPACASSSPACCMMCSSYKLNKQGDTMQPQHTLFPIWSLSIVPCVVLTVDSWPTYRFLKRQVRQSDIPISWRIFQFVVIHAFKIFSVINEAEVDIFLELMFFLWSKRCWQFDLWSSAFSKCSLNIWNCLFPVLLNPRLENYEHYFASTWDECNCVVVWTSFGIAILWDWN